MLQNNAIKVTLLIKAMTLIAAKTEQQRWVRESLNKLFRCIASDVQNANQTFHDYGQKEFFQFFTLKAKK